MTCLRVSVPAKLNLHLQVLGRRPDGYHELRTLLQSIDLADDLWADDRGAGGLELEVSPAGSAPEGPDNLVLVAARALAEATGRAADARLGLVKRIPAGAGLGGGSADAAAALVLLDRLWGTGLGTARLSSIAATVGSDVPFFLHGGLALGVGRGEEVIPLDDLPTTWVVVVTPPVTVSTAVVYRRLETSDVWRRPDPTVYDFYTGLTQELPWSRIRNDLQSGVITGWPEIGEVLDELGSTTPRHAAVTGSGSAVFAAYDGAEPARRAAVDLQRRGRVHVGVTLPRRAARLEPTDCR